MDNFERFQAYISASNELSSWKLRELRQAFEAIIHLADDSEKLVASAEVTADYSLKIMIACIRSYKAKVEAANAINIDCSGLKGPRP